MRPTRTLSDTITCQEPCSSVTTVLADGQADSHRTLERFQFALWSLALDVLTAEWDQQTQNRHLARVSPEAETKWKRETKAFKSKHSFPYDVPTQKDTVKNEGKTTQWNILCEAGRSLEQKLLGMHRPRGDLVDVDSPRRV